jgi:hypothetical protein
MISAFSHSLVISQTVFDAIQSAKYSLDTATASSIEGASSLLDKDHIVPNQKSWPETAEWMGAKVQHQKCLPEEHGATEQSIGITNGKHCCIHNDPYAGGERSGKHTKPNALSAAVNVHARACVPLPVSATPPSATAPPSTTTPYFAFRSAPPSQP